MKVERRVGPASGVWVVTTIGTVRGGASYRTKAEAARAAEDAVRIKGGMVRIHGPDGRTSESFTIGRDAFAKISAIEGREISREMRQDLSEFDRKGLSSRERGRRIVRKYGGKPS